MCSAQGTIPFTFQISLHSFSTNVIESPSIPLYKGSEPTPILWTVRKAATKEQGGQKWYQEDHLQGSSRLKQSG